MKKAIKYRSFFYRYDHRYWKDRFGQDEKYIYLEVDGVAFLVMDEAVVDDHGEEDDALDVSILLAVLGASKGLHYEELAVDL